MVEIKETKRKNDRNMASIYTPKLIVLVSMHPIYNQMKNFLEGIRIMIMNETLWSIENLLLNLIYEFPHPGEKLLWISEFWAKLNLDPFRKENQMFTKGNDEFSYENMEIQAFWELSNYKDESKLF